ncbi:MAG: GerAB/ArcD/ProY family transporter, partial [Bacilli bacterium]
MENKNNNSDNQRWNPLTSKNISHKQVVISPRQSGSLIASTLIGVGVLTLPRVTASAAHEAAWLATLLGSIIAVVALIIITKLGFRFPQKSIVSYSAIILGPKKKKWKVIGRILSAPFILCLFGFWTISTAMVARTFGEVVVTAVLLETPIE